MGILVFMIDDLRLEIKPSMIFLTMSELISGLIAYKSMGLVYQEISLADSSFCIGIRRGKKGTVMLTANSQSVVIEENELFREIVESSYSFYSRFRMNLNPAVKNDLDAAFENAKWTFKF